MVNNRGVIVGRHASGTTLSLCTQEEILAESIKHNQVANNLHDTFILKTTCTDKYVILLLRKIQGLEMV